MRTGKNNFSKWVCHGDDEDDDFASGLRSWKDALFFLILGVRFIFAILIYIYISNRQYSVFACLCCCLGELRIHKYHI